MRDRTYGCGHRPYRGRCPRGYVNRLKALEDGERGVLSNARCLGEGIDVPTLDGIAFVDPKHSEVDIV